jgi:hypothetical protein
MNTIDWLKLQSQIRIQNEVQPKTYLDELAEYGMLDEFLEEYFHKKLDIDADFKERIYESYYKYAASINENLELYYLESICESLSFFIEYTSTCKIQKLLDRK